jgi:pyruvate,water dikinase
MKQAAGIITDHGGRTSHAAIVSRELGIPAVIGTGEATETLESGREITLSCAEGDEGYVYDGILEFDICGQAPSDCPDFAAFLVQSGIDFISLNPNSVIRGKQRVAEAEGNRGVA